MDIFEKELAIADATYEATVNRIVSMDSIESMYMTEASGDGDNFFKKLIQAFKDFIKKIKDTIKRKMEERELKKALKEITDAGIKEIELELDYDEYQAYIKKMYVEQIKELNKYAADIVKASSEKEINDIIEKIEKLYKNIDSYVEKKTQKKYKKDIVSLTRSMSTTSTQFFDELDNITLNTITKYSELAQKIEKDNKRDALLAKRKAAIKKCSNAVTNIGHKISSAFSKVNMKVIGKIAVIAGSAAAAGAGAKITYSAINKKKNSATTESVSVDDLLDDMISDLSGEV